MRRLILVAMIAGLLAPVGLHAQAVYAKDGMAIFDFTEGMPAGTITSKSKTEVYRNATPSLESIIEGNKDGEGINAELYQKLEIALHDMDGQGKIGISGDDVSLDWVSAFEGCRDADHNGNIGWRLPTLWELQLMYVFNDALNDVIREDLHGTAFDSSIDSSYWSATESTEWFSSWGVGFNNGNTSTSYKIMSMYTSRVRCVREIP